MEKDASDALENLQIEIAARAKGFKKAWDWADRTLQEFHAWEAPYGQTPFRVRLEIPRNAGSNGGAEESPASDSAPDEAGGGGRPGGGQIPAGAEEVEKGAEVRTEAGALCEGSPQGRAECERCRLTGGACCPGHAT